MIGLTFVELDAQMAELYGRLPPRPPTRLLFACVEDVHLFRALIETGEPKPPRYVEALPLVGIPILIDKALPEGVAEFHAGTTVRRFELYGNALPPEREATLAPF